MCLTRLPEGRRQFDNSQECMEKNRQWRRHANENTLEQNASIDCDDTDDEYIVGKGF